MATVVLEQLLPAPVRLEDVSVMEQQAVWCMERYRARHTLSLLSTDGIRLSCVFDAPDAEAMRNVVRTLGAPYEHLWSATTHASAALAVEAALPGPPSTLVVVERSFDAPTQFEEVQALENRSSWCLDQHRVRFLRTYFSSDRRRMLCIYTAPDAESVRLAQNTAGLPLERVWAALAYETL